ncbi:hypothetical protein [Nostoc sp.]|uniref:hypothetical protein n=1 Tax=Nostoc sp. TaxID=1180 RepID=UPI002FFADC59
MSSAIAFINGDKVLALCFLVSLNCYGNLMSSAIAFTNGDKVSALCFFSVVELLWKLDVKCDRIY